MLAAPCACLLFSSSAHLAQARGEVSDELHQVLHGLDDLGHAQIVEDLLALGDDLAHLGLIENEQHIRCALQDPPVTCWFKVL